METRRMFEMESPQAWQVKVRMVSTFEQIQVPNERGLGIQSSKL